MLAALLKPLLGHPAGIAMETTIDNPALDRAGGRLMFDLLAQLLARAPTSCSQNPPRENA